MRISFLIFLTLLFASPLRAADDELFEKKIRPLLVNHCLECHGPKKAKGGLRLDTREEMLKGGDSGPALELNNPDGSLLVKNTRYDGDVKMPPRGKLADADIAALAEWVKAGAVWPKDAKLAVGGDAAKVKPFDLAARAKAHWSFQPREKLVPLPPIDQTQIDYYIEESLAKSGLKLAPPASRRTLVRRLHFDLVGLPPSPAEIAAFEKDDSPDAYETLVEKLLASPQYGVRWARHWLDLVRFAETCGHEFDYEIPNAWRYRDYVVRAMNADVPYDKFLHEHIAGDLLPNPRRHPKDNSNESIQATGFWYFHEAKHSPVDSRSDYADRVDNQIDVFGKTVFGLTLGCARCHDHKFDPVSAKDYYALFGVIASSRYQQAFIDDPAPTAKLLDEMKTLRPAAEAKFPELGSHGGLTPRRSPSLDADWRTHWFATGLGLRDLGDGGYPHSGRESVKLAAGLRSPTVVIDRPMLAVRVAGQNARVRFVLNNMELIRNPIYGGLVQKIDHGTSLKWLVFDFKMWQGQPGHLEFTDDGAGWFAVTDARWVDEKPANEKGEVPAPPAANNEQLRALEARIPAPRTAPAMSDGNGRNERVFIRGSHKNPGEEVPRRNLEAFGLAPFAAPGSGRLELARAVTDPANPLVARVMVNRIWKHHFGEGLVRSTDDFGLQGQPPTHPELLDYLADRFIREGWSVKRLHREMVLSKTYRQASRAEPAVEAMAATVDPQNKLLHRQNVRRLEAEAIRDSLLAVSGRLDLAMEGPGVLPHLSDHISGRGKPASGPLDGNGRRSLYLQVRRNFLNPMFVAFDYPTPFTTIGRRSVSNVPAQALAMLNNPFVLQQADLWAKRVLSVEATDAERLRGMYLTAFGREPTAIESNSAMQFLRESEAERTQTWTDLAHVLLNTKEFILVP